MSNTDRERTVRKLAVHLRRESVGGLSGHRYGSHQLVDVCDGSLPQWLECRGLGHNEFHGGLGSRNRTSEAGGAPVAGHGVRPEVLETDLAENGEGGGVCRWRGKGSSDGDDVCSFLAHPEYGVLRSERRIAGEEGHVANVVDDDVGVQSRDCGRRGELVAGRGITTRLKRQQSI